MMRGWSAWVPATPPPPVLPALRRISGSTTKNSAPRTAPDTLVIPKMVATRSTVNERK